MEERWVRSLGREDSLEKEMATHFSIVAWRIPWTEESGRLQYRGSHRVRHDWSNLAHMHAYTGEHDHASKGGTESSILLHDMGKLLSIRHLLITKVQGVIDLLPQRQQKAKLQRWHKLNIRITISLNYKRFSKYLASAQWMPLYPCNPKHSHHADCVQIS